jgi:hypothetical protein
MIRLRPAILALSALLLAGGCETKPSPVDPARFGPTFSPKNTYGEKRLPRSLHRVLLLPVHGGPFASPETCEALDLVFATALEKQMRFEVVTLSREECEMSFGVPDIGSADALPRDFLEILGRQYGAEAVVFVDITAYQGYRPLMLGVRSKLANVADHRLIWAFDQEFSVLDPSVANGVRRFFLANADGPVPYDPTEGVLQSPTRFAAYAADAVFKTLPPR